MTSGLRKGAIAAAVAVVAIGAGCKKEKQFLIEVGLKTATPVSGLSSLRITIAGTTKSIPLTALSPAPVVYGIYIPDDLGTQIQVSAGAQTGSSCVGLAGSGAATIDEKDGIGTTEIELVPGNACSEPQPPSLKRCVEYDHMLNAAACDPTDVDNNIYVRSVAFSPDGKFFVTSANDGRVKIWTFDGRSLRAEGTVLTKVGTPAIAFSPDGKLLALANVADYPEPVDLYNVGTWSKRRSLPGITSYVAGIRFTPDNRYVIALEADGAGGGDLLALPVSGGTPGPALPLAVNPWWLAVAQTEGPGGVAVAVATRSDQAALLAFDDGDFSAPTVFSVTNDPAQLAWAIGFSPDGRFLAAGGDDGAFHYWNVPFQTATPASAAFTVGESLTTLAFSPANDYVAVSAGGGSYGSLTIWDLLAHTKRAEYLPTYAPYGIAYAPSGTAIAGGEDTCGKVFVCAD